MLRYTNRMGDTYYVHARRDASGRTRYTARRDAEGAIESLPEGYEISESVNGQVSVRKQRPRKITADEERAVQHALTERGLDRYRVEVKGSAIIIHEPNHDDASLDALAERYTNYTFDLPGGIGSQVEGMLRQELGDEVFERIIAEGKERARSLLASTNRYEAVLKLKLTERQRRRFGISRMCFRGEGGWLGLDEGELAELLPRYVPHLGRESFFQLI